MALNKCRENTEYHIRNDIGNNSKNHNHSPCAGLAHTHPHANTEREETVTVFRCPALALDSVSSNDSKQTPPSATHTYRHKLLEGPPDLGIQVGIQEAEVGVQFRERMLREKDVGSRPVRCVAVCRKTVSASILTTIQGGERKKMNKKRHTP